jgi:hypothetical protein
MRCETMIALCRDLERELMIATRRYETSERTLDKVIAQRDSAEQSLASADGRSVGNSEQVQKDWNNAAGQLDAIAKVLGYPVESWRIAGCDFLAHAVRGLQDAYIGLKGSTDALLRDADAKLSVAQSSERRTEEEWRLGWIVRENEIARLKAELASARSATRATDPDVQRVLKILGTYAENAADRKLNGHNGWIPLEDCHLEVLLRMASTEQGAKHG